MNASIFQSYTHSAFWATWAVILIAQNLSFTFVSRARNSGSLQRHMIAGLLSNGIWFLSQVFAVGTITTILMGGHGWYLGVYAGSFYTVFTLIGSLVGHKVSLKTEKGKGMVGANEKYKQVTLAEWADVASLIKETRAAKERGL